MLTNTCVWITTNISRIIMPISRQFVIHFPRCIYSALHEEDLSAGLWIKYAHYLSSGPCNTNMNSEVIIWEQHWIRCPKELNQWDILLDYAQANREQNEILVMESAWRVAKWNLMK
uniref:Uncharacterized protein n=1 Tax=Glossina pallidipes TaxID=7398 RepID=A0A1B0AFA0_GLOPL